MRGTFLPYLPIVYLSSSPGAVRLLVTKPGLTVEVGK